MFFLLFYISPFAFLGFYTVGYIYSCTVDPSRARIQFPLRFPASLALRIPRFRSHSTCAPRRNLPIPPLLLRTRLAPFAPRHAPATAVVCLFWARPAVCQRINGRLYEYLSVVRVPASGKYLIRMEGLILDAAPFLTSTFRWPLSQ